MDLIESGDICSLIFLLILLTAVGRLFVANVPHVRELGLRIVAGYGLLYAVLAFAEKGFGTPAEVVGVVLRSLTVAGLLLGPSWIVLSVSSFLRDYWNRMIAKVQARAEAKRIEHDRQHSEAKERERKHVAAEEWERNRPLREQATRENEARAQSEASERAAAQKRREDARTACELAYAVAVPDIADRFSRQDLTEFSAKYLIDHFPPEVVEERSQQLLSIIESHLHRVLPPPRFQSLQELAEWFEERKAEIEAISDARHRATLLVQLKERYSELTSQLLAEMTP